MLSEDKVARIPVLTSLAKRDSIAKSGSFEYDRRR